MTSLLASKLAGASIICPSNPQPKALIEAARGQRASHVAPWSTQLRQLLDQPDAVDIMEQLTPSSAQQLVCSCSQAAGTPNALGLTETLGPHSMEYAGRPLPVGREGSFGRQDGDIPRAIFDPATHAKLPSGVIGEIALCGGHLKLGLRGRAQDDVFTADDWYMTGDFGRID